MKTEPLFFFVSLNQVYTYLSFCCIQGTNRSACKIHCANKPLPQATVARTTKKQAMRAKMESIAKLIVAVLLPILLLSDRARSQCIDGCACFPFSAPVTMDCTPRPDITGVDTLFTYVPAVAAATINRM